MIGILKSRSQRSIENVDSHRLLCTNRSLIEFEFSVDDGKNNKKPIQLFQLSWLVWNLKL